ncbi:MAG: MFS transporter [Candidatus Eisenbacteria bacterium]|uniref:MFS transporter n=1 Tax=Eiseniibacteriota bacterium TaxID=2212470 RepID=A0A937XAZ8_UNCEI|nr:MFS transporter [Candidatus Eisenbacteria bacterium]
MEPAGPSTSPDRARRPHTFAALGYRNYRLWFAGQLVSLFGTWMQMTAQGYLVFELTRSSAYLGYVAFAAGAPAWIFTLYGGVIADRMPRKTLMLITQASMMALALALADLTFGGLIRPGHILAFAFLLGIANAFDAPARQAFVLEMVSRRDLTNAIALNATMFHTATALGPAAAGFTYAAFGPGWCFLINGVSFLAVILALLLMKLAPAQGERRRTSAAADLLEGLRYVRRHTVIRALIVLIGLMSLFGIGLYTLMPAWAVKMLGGDARTLGLLQSARGAGALLGALALASLSRFRYKGRLLTAGTFAFPLLMLAFAGLRRLPLSLALLVGVGAAQILVMNLANAIIQGRVSDALRGRVMGLYTMAFFGLLPLGGLLAGSVAHRVGEPLALVLASLALLAGAGAIWVFQPRLRALEGE